MLELTQEEKETLVRSLLRNRELLLLLAEIECLPEGLFAKLIELGQHFMFAVARNPSAPPGVLKRLALAMECDRWLAQIIAANPTSDAETLHIIYDRWSQDSLVCAKLAANTNLPPYLMGKIYRNNTSSSVVLTALAGNPNLKVDLQTELLTNYDISVRMSLASNPSVAPDILRRLALNTTSWHVRCKVAENKNAPPDVLEKLFVMALKKRNHSDMGGIVERVAVNVLENPSVPREVLLYASMDEDEHIKHVALSVLEKRGGGENSLGY